MNPTLFAAGGNNWRDATVALDLIGRLISLTLAAQRRDQAWSQRRPGSGK
jgi:hypothetical protein